MPTYQFTYDEFNHIDDLLPSDAALLLHARQATQNAYAPYSKFHVGAVIKLDNDKIVTGVNIENAAYPVGVCAERSALASAISSYPNQIIEAIAISYQAPNGESDTPVFPCGMCRQFLVECESRNQKDIRIILSGQEGQIIVLSSAKDILPFSFSGDDLG